jgi:SAM-dependent methyltransferase
MNQIDIDDFNSRYDEIEKFWRRIEKISDGKESFNVEGKKFLDIGSGRGRFVIEAGKRGALKSVGVDIYEPFIEFSNENLNTNYPELKDKVEFKLIDLCKYEDETFDIICSKDALEHIMDLDNMIDCAYNKLKKGGKFYIGFGPLYYSHNGEHDTIAPFKWAHLILPESYLISRYNKINSTNIKSVEDLTLNKLKFKDYKRIFENSRFEIEYFQRNVTEHWIGKLQNILSYIPFLREYFSFNIYCVLKK